MRMGLIMKQPATAVLICLALAGPATAASPRGEQCQKEQASIPFSSGARSYHAFLWRNAIRDLQDASELCPVPPKPFSVSIEPFVIYPYAPFYYLGRSLDNDGDAPAALRYFYLSSCFERAEEGIEELDNLPTLTDRSQRMIASLQQSDKAPAPFGDGSVAVQEKDWQKAAEKMWASMLIRPEDGKATMPAGRWPEQYVPRFHLGRALFELGCYRQACEQLNRSKLKALAAADHSGKYKEEIEEMAWLEAQCAAGPKGKPQSDWICRQWVCLLQQDRRSAQ